MYIMSGDRPGSCLAEAFYETPQNLSTFDPTRSDERVSFCLSLIFSENRLPLFGIIL